MKTILILTANDANNRLHNLARESNDIQHSLNNVPLKNYLVVPVSEATTDNIIRELNVPNRQVEVLHYAGHANGSILRLTDTDATAKALSEKLRAYPNLKFVFLNGCATRQQVELFHNVGVPLVLATTREVGDKKAYWLATTLYEYMASGKSLRQAFEQVVRDNNLSKKGIQFSSDRGIIAIDEISGEEILPWALYAKDEETDYSLPLLIENEVNTSNLDTKMEHIHEPSKKLAIGMVATEIIIGVLGELMPDDFKGNIKNYLGGDKFYTYIWFSIVLLTVAFFIHLFLKYEGFLSQKIAYKTTKSGQNIVTNYQSTVNDNRSWWQRIFYYFFKSLQPDADFIRAINLPQNEELGYIKALKVYSPLHFKTEQGEQQDLTQFLLQKLENIATIKDYTEGSHFFILGESGCGKTTILYKVFCDFAKRFPQHPIIIRELRKGYADILDMKLEDQKQTIILLDGLDEDWDIIQNAEAKIEALAAKFLNFKGVVLSARTQLYKNHAEELKKLNQSTFQHLYLGTLSDPDVEVFLRKKFGLKKGFQIRRSKKNVAKFENANAFLSENNRFDVLRRPFLLQNIEDFLPENSIKTPINTHRFTFEYEIYQQLIQKWIEREAEIVVEKMDKTANSQRKKLYCENLNALSQSLATTFFEHNELDISIDTILYESWVNEFLKDREKPLARTHSLLSRYEDNLFHFAHRSIFDFFLAEAVFNCRILEKDFRNRKNEYTDAFDFYNQMCWHRLARLDFEVKQELDDNGDCQKFIDEQYGQGGADAYEKYIQPNDTMSVRAFLLGNMPDLNKLKGNLTSDDTLFVILGEVIYQKIKSLASIMEQLLACAEKLTNSSTKTLTTQEVIDCGKSLTLSKAIKLFLHDITGKGDYVFIHPLFFQFFQIGRFAGVAVKISKHNFKTIVAPKRHFIPPLSIFFDFENEWLEERVFFNQIKIWNNEKAQKDLLVEKAYHDLRMQSELFLQNNELELAELRQFLTRFPKTYHLLDVRNNLLRGYLSENEMPENARFKIRLEGNPLTDAQKATCLDTLRPYLHTETVIDFEKTLGRGLYPCMVTIEGGTFIMGDDELLTPATTKPNQTKKDNYPHEVTVNSFKMAQFQVTVRQFAEFIKETSYQTDAEKKGTSVAFTGRGKEGLTVENNINWRFDAEGKERLKTDWEHPVIHVSWFDAVAYCNWLSKKQELTPVYDFSDTENVKIDIKAKGYRLPTEAEWEFAAGNGAKYTKYSWGDDAPKNKLGGNVVDETFKKYLRDTLNKGIFDTYFKDYDSGFAFTAPVGSFKPNDFDLFDMTGNVNEWCNDWYDEDYYQNSPSLNPINIDSLSPIENTLENTVTPIEGSLRVFRGGSWLGDAGSCRVAYRHYYAPTLRRPSMGFRVVSSFQ